MAQDMGHIGEHKGWMLAQYATHSPELLWGGKVSAERVARYIFN